MKNKIIISIVFSLLFLSPLTAMSEEKSALDYFHNPFSWMHNGADYRLRVNATENMQTLSNDRLNEDWLYQRHRLRLWTRMELGSTVDLNARLAWEFYDYQKPYARSQYTEYNEVLFDILNFTIKKPFGLPVKAVIGRQDIMIGKGWLIFEGTPYDGSRTMSYDAARFTIDIASIGSTLDLIYIDQKPEGSRWLKPISYEHKDVMASEERGLILYYSTKLDENIKLDTYAIYKNDNPVDREVVPAASRKAELITFGGAIEQKLNDKWDYRFEGAYQAGTRENRLTDTQADAKAWGILSNLRRTFDSKYNNEMHFSIEHLSGDDPNTADNEQFDPVWGKWPQWANLFLYLYIPETTSVGEITNFTRFNIGHTFNPAAKWKINTEYHLLLTDENNKPVVSSPLTGLEYSEAGKVRGHLLTNDVAYKFNNHLKTDLLFELFKPGNYYAGNTRDCAYFIRWQTIFTF